MATVYRRLPRDQLQLFGTGAAIKFRGGEIPGRGPPRTVPETHSGA
jgi:hypothetical protein